MILPSTTHPQLTRPIPSYLAEISKLRNVPRLSCLYDSIDNAHQSLLALRVCTEQLPDLSGYTWFLHQNFVSTCEQSIEKLRIAEEQMTILGTSLYEDGDPFNLVWFVAGFVNFARQARITPELFQQPFEMEFEPHYPTETTVQEAANAWEPSLDVF